ncbi:uncharacterized protein BBA_08904 [Beauveria bassiana ARSEF 2860]|uniref:Uncharacterized protein n=1 Tax=Beauveria bassiana (strain ARSEF 2860) TaxID=655819 RepID=J4UGP9_BEAB2|nr:uncharacterized protein BBA_08904 [Beauveria bassiana ARSEF 2860]EJP62107.1 hypothetical protein BBA_08904 [Beauveria bassiana ARSEF 2860]
MGVTLDHLFAHLQGRLRRWELDLKVGGQHGSSGLDSQLESAPEDLGLSIEFQLRALKLHLSRVESLMSSCHQLLLTSEMISSPSEDELLDKNVLSLLDKLNFKLDQISFTLDRLQKFAANLLYHTETGLGLKIIDYRRRHDDSAFNQSVRDYVNTRYPSIRPSQYRSSELKQCLEPTETSCEPDQKTAKDQLAHLHETLVNMILFRHYRKLYERENMEEPLMPLPEKKPSRGSQAMVTVARRASALVDTARQKGSQIAAFATSLNENASDGRQIAVRNWDLRESILNRNLQQKQANVNRPCTSEENLTCPVCDQVYYSDTLQGENWKRHFIIIEDSTPNARDDRCGEAYSASLCNGSDWKERLRQRHGTEWLPLRVPLFWTCSLCRRVPRMEKASRALMMDALISHMLDAREKIGGQAMQSSIGWTTVFLMPPSETCPICETCHLLDGTTTTTPTKGGGGGGAVAADDDDDAQAKKALQEARDVAWKKTEDCIGKHVLEMAVHFARYRRAASDQAVAVAAVVPGTTNNMERAEKMTLLARKGFRKAAKRLSTVTQGIRS